MKKHRLIPVLLCTGLLAGILAGCTNIAAGITDPSPSTSDTGTTAETLRFAESYSDIYQVLNDARTSSYGLDGLGGMTAEAAAGDMDVAQSAPASAPAARDETFESNGKSYSGTNVQVEGIDEGDIVKTDGDYIYVLRDNELIIFRAAGEETVRVSTTTVATKNTEEAFDEKVRANDYATDIYVSGDTAAVVLTQYSYMPYIAEDMPTGDNARVEMEPYGVDKQISVLRLYDITDRANPTLTKELGQDGYVLTTRLIGTTLYMISTYSVYDPREDNSETFIPSVYTDGTASLIKAGDIAIMPYIDTTSHTVVCAYDLDAAALSASQSILSGGSTVYMNADTLYIAEATSRLTTGTPYEQNVYTVIDYTRTDVTNITSFDITGGALSLKASATVDGSLYSQFNMDEFDGNLRVVTTRNNQNWTEYTDAEMGWTNYVWDDASTSNALYVLDSTLTVIGSVSDLAPDEQVYGVRYDGTIGYIVTFQRVDPLFAVDLSDPTKPTVLSALKIPGFSEYLHVYGDGRLFGLGMDADEETGRTSGMKLSMFNTENPADVTLKHTLKLDTDYSVALYNHKAILISPERSMIGFPTDIGYDIYGYSDDTGFYKRASLDLDAVDWYNNSRGLYIDDNAYIVGMSAVTILNLNDLSVLKQINY